MIARSRALAACALAGLPAAAPAQSITGLGSLPGANFHLSRGVSACGATVVGQASSTGSPLAWRWTPAGGMQSLGYVGYAFGVSADGVVVVGEQGFTSSQAVRWTLAGGPQGLGWLRPTHTRSAARAVSADGSVIVGNSSLGTADAEAFRWTQAGGLGGLGFLPGHTHSNATGVSADGSVVVGSSYLYMPGGGYPQEAFRFVQGGGMTGVGFLPGKNASGAAAISADGMTVVGSSYIIGVPGSEPFSWTPAGGMQRIGMLPGASACDPVGVSADGSIIVGSCLVGGSVPFIWSAAGGMRPLAVALVNEYGVDLMGWQLGSVAAISADGRAIVGSGTNPDGLPEPYLVLLPAPCYANCDGSTGTPALNVNDFVCFQARFAAADQRADCDHSSSLNVLDFVCFQAANVEGSQGSTS